jgi:hypothetical protein
MIRDVRLFETSFLCLSSNLNESKFSLEIALGLGLSGTYFAQHCPILLLNERSIKVYRPPSFLCFLAEGCPTLWYSRDPREI